MPVEFVTTPHFVRFDATGDVEPDEIMAALDACWSIHDAPLALWDVRKGSLSSMAFDRFADIFRTAAKFKGKRGAAPRTAIVARDIVQLRLLKAFIVQASAHSPISFRTFLNYDDAERWLLSGAGEEGGPSKTA